MPPWEDAVVLSWVRWPCFFITAYSITFLFFMCSVLFVSLLPSCSLLFSLGLFLFAAIIIPVVVHTYISQVRYLKKIAFLLHNHSLRTDAAANGA